MIRTLSTALAFGFLAALCCAGCNRAQTKPAPPAEQPAPQPDLQTADPHKPRIRLNQPIPGDPRASFDVVNLDDDNLAKLGKVEWKPEEWAALFGVYVDQGKGVDRANQPPVAGTYRVEENALRFAPQFPPAPGVTYRAFFDPARLPVRGDAQLVEQKFDIPKLQAKPTVIEQVYPTRLLLPENQLKFYIHFSAPMSRGEAYKHIRLILIETKDNKRTEKVIERPFLELDEELWDPSGKRFTLLFDPGRIKRGLKPRAELGPALEEGKQYALAISRAWRDARGEPLEEAFRKEFRVLAPDDAIPDPKKWEVVAPPAATDVPVVITFPEPMDHALLQRCITVLDPKGRKRLGKVTAKFQETRWEFEPEDAWEVGKYQLIVDTDLEDLAGNNLRRPFEVDVFKKVDGQVKTETISIPFVVPIPGQEKK